MELTDLFIYFSLEFNRIHFLKFKFKDELISFVLSKESSFIVIRVSTRPLWTRLKKKESLISRISS